VDAEAGAGAAADERLRATEVVASLCLATDVAMGFPFEHGLDATLVAMRLADRLGVDPATASQTYYGCLLMYSGCTTDAEIAAGMFRGSVTENFIPVMFGSTGEAVRGLARSLPSPGDPAPVRAMQMARRLPRAALRQRPHLTAMCEIGEMIARRLGMPASTHRLFAHATERWDGKGLLRRAREDEIPLAVRIVHVARDATLQHVLGGVDRAVTLVRERAGRAFDPEVAGRFVADAPDLLAPGGESSSWDDVLVSEPAPQIVLEDDGIDDALAAIGDFTDLASPFMSGHSAGVARLAAASARSCRLGPTDVRRVRRAALVHDVGRVAVHPRVWQKADPLGADDWEQVRLHPYQTERILSRSPLLADLAAIAGAHHERLDGSGYHRGAARGELTTPARLLAAADVFHAMTEPRPHRPAHTPEQAAEQLATEATAGRLDADAVTAVIEAAGQPPPRLERPAGLTPREVEVVRLLAHGLQTKQVARALGVSAKTADRHVQNAYRKFGVSSRAAATLMAMEHGLLSWGELPIPRSDPRS
jgi:HD-GYP domain-containing protein (c-di-GMP phosphodiesterase class II)